MKRLKCDISAKEIMIFEQTQRHLEEGEHFKILSVV